jgi:hypothetical protein
MDNILFFIEKIEFHLVGILRGVEKTPDLCRLLRIKNLTKHRGQK